MRRKSFVQSPERASTIQDESPISKQREVGSQNETQAVGDSIQLTDSMEASYQEPQPSTSGIIQKILTRLNPTDSSRTHSYQSLSDLQDLPDSGSSSAICQSQTESRPTIYPSLLDVGFPTPTRPALRHVRVPSELSLPPGYHSRTSLAAPVGPTDVIGICNQMSFISRNIVVLLPDINQIITVILDAYRDAYRESRKWKKTKARISSLAERIGSISTQVEELEKNTKDMTMQDWAENKINILTSVKGLSLMCDVLSVKISHLKEDLSDQSCVLLMPERTRISNTLKVLTADLERLEQRIQIIACTSEAENFYTFEIERGDEGRRCKITNWESMCIVVIIFACLITFSFLMFNFFSSKSKL